MPTIAFDRFYRYDELTALLQSYAAEYPNLVQMESIGRSHEGRDIWLVTLTNTATGPATDKPAVWIDGNIHAIEVTASAACLVHLHTLVTEYGADADITHCLDTRAVYLCPRIDVDGAEWALADRPRWIRSSTRPYPHADEPVTGLIGGEDMDGDGRILTMRVRDPNGGWKAHPDAPRLMVRRDPIERGGDYYRLLPEGRLLNYDGVNIQVVNPPQGLDLNRNFPVEWRQEVEQRGAGPYPVSEPEVRAVVDFITTHPNITAGVSFHTSGGVLLRPPSFRADETYPPHDLWTFEKIGAKGEELTGYPHTSVYAGFRSHSQESTTGAFDDWAYEHLGIFAWTVEIWAAMKEAGIKDYKIREWYREHPVADDLQMLRWNDEVLGGTAYVDWYPYTHPQLGEVELGGWNSLGALANPPLAQLEQEVRRFPRWLVWHTLISPKLELRETSATRLSDGVYRVRLVVDNSGWLPTYITKQALARKAVRGVRCEIELSEGMTLEGGHARQELGQLEGQAYKAAWRYQSGESTDDRLMAEWIVRGPAGSAVQLSARHDRAGVIRTTVTLG